VNMLVRGGQNSLARLRQNIEEGFKPRAIDVECVGGQVKVIQNDEIKVRVLAQLSNNFVESGHRHRSDFGAGLPLVSVHQGVQTLVVDQSLKQPKKGVSYASIRTKT